jgi:alginate O-acetyltransferase complex protein AlgI
VRTFLNLMVTMLFGGLWHGANWTFVVWGAYHGLLLAFDNLVKGRIRFWPLTFVLANIGWVFFRSASLPQSLAVLRQLVPTHKGLPILLKWHYGLALLALAVALVEEKTGLFDRLARGPAWAYATAMAAMLLVLEIFGVTDASIPFQF